MSDYPKTLYHPAFNPGKPAKPLSGQDLIDGKEQEAGIPARFPPVTVKTQKDEDYHRAMGYMGQQESHVFAAYSEYPKMMVHPDHVDAIPDEIDAKKEENGSITRIVKPGRPEVHPHAFVNSEEEEEAYRAKGYELPGVFDPKTAADLRVNHIEGYEAEQYPALIDGNVVNPNAAAGGPDEYPKYVNGTIVNSYAEEMALKGPEDPEAVAKRDADAKAARRAELLAELEALDGAAPIDAAALAADIGEATKPGDRETLLAEAKAKGIKVHHKWSLDKLQEALKAA